MTPHNPDVSFFVRFGKWSDYNNAYQCTKCALADLKWVGNCQICGTYHPPTLGIVKCRKILFKYHLSLFHFLTFGLFRKIVQYEYQWKFIGKAPTYSWVYTPFVKSHERLEV